MDENQLDSDKSEKVDIIKFDIIQIKQNVFKYDLNIETKENTIYNLML